MRVYLRAQYVLRPFLAQACSKAAWRCSQKNDVKEHLNVHHGDTYYIKENYLYEKRDRYRDRASFLMTVT